MESIGDMLQIYYKFKANRLAKLSTTYGDCWKGKSCDKSLIYHVLDKKIKYDKYLSYLTNKSKIIPYVDINSQFSNAIVYESDLAILKKYLKTGYQITFPDLKSATEKCHSQFNDETCQSKLGQLLDHTDLNTMDDKQKNELLNLYLKRSEKPELKSFSQLKDKLGLAAFIRRGALNSIIWGCVSSKVVDCQKKITDIIDIYQKMDIKFDPKYQEKIMTSLFERADNSSEFINHFREKIGLTHFDGTKILNRKLCSIVYGDRRWMRISQETDLKYIEYLFENATIDYGKFKFNNIDSRIDLSKMCIEKMISKCGYDHGHQIMIQNELMFNALYRRNIYCRTDQCREEWDAYVNYLKQYDLPAKNKAGLSVEEVHAESERIWKEYEDHYPSY